MAFPDGVVQQAWFRSGGRCECERTTHGHWGRCNRQLRWDHRGWETSDSWEAHHKTAVNVGGQDVLSNCESFARIATRRPKRMAVR